MAFLFFTSSPLLIRLAPLIYLTKQISPGSVLAIEVLVNTQHHPDFRAYLLLRGIEPQPRCSKLNNNPPRYSMLYSVIYICKIKIFYAI